MIETRPLEIQDFAGGITDNYVDAELNKSKRLDNLLISYNRKLFSRPGSDIFNEDYYQIPAGAQRINSLINFDNDSNLIQISAKNAYTTLGGGWSTLLGPSSNSVFDAGSVNSIVSYGQWNKHLYVTNDDYATVTKIYKDNSGNFKVRTAGLPVIGSPTVTAGAAGAFNYLYAFLYEYTYQSSNKTFQDFGGTTIVELSSAAAPNVSAVSITAIPVITNGATGNYDTSNIKVWIYRTIAGGTTFYKVSEVTNGTTSYSDNMSDTTLQDNETLYTTGGVVDNEPPPVCKLMHVAGNYGFFANIKEGSELIPNRLRQSIPGDIDSSPSDFYVDIDLEITGLSSYGGDPVLIAKQGVYRVDGRFDDLGTGGMFAKKIDDTATCVSQASIVQIPEGIVWAGVDGIYFSDSYIVKKISIGLNTTYEQFVSTTAKQKRIRGAYDAVERRVWWAVTNDDGSTDNDSCLVLDVRWGIKPDSVFTTTSGGDSFAPSDIVFYNKKLTRADKRGYVFTHDDATYSDPMINTLVAPTSWQRQVIIFDYISSAMNFGTTFVRKWVPRIVLTASNRTNVSIQIRSINDDNKKVRDLSEIRFRGNVVWGDTEVTWGDADTVWNFNGLIEEQRRFPANSLRCSYKQIQVTNSYTVVTNSDSLGLAYVDANINTVTLNEYDGMDPLTVTWPADSVGYFISFEADGYSRQYPITARTDGTLTFADAVDTIPDGNTKWLLSGYQTNEAINLLGYTVHWAPLSKTQDMYHGAQGSNA